MSFESLLEPLLVTYIGQQIIYNFRFPTTDRKCDRINVFRTFIYLNVQLWVQFYPVI